MSKELSDIIKKSFELINQKDYTQAIELLYKSLETYPDNIEILTQIAQCYSLLNEVDKAIDYYETAFRLNNTSTIILDSLIEILIKNENYNKAEYYVNFYLQCEDKIYATQKYLETLLKIENFEAIENFANSNNCDFLNSESNTTIASAILKIAENKDNDEKQNKLATAEEYAKKALALDKNNNKATCILAECYVIEKDYKKAEEILKEIPNAENSFECLNMMGLIKYYQDNLETATEYFNAAIKTNSNIPSIYYNLSEAYYRQGWLNEAETAIKQAIGLDEKNIDYRLALADIYYVKKEYDKALLTLAFVQELEPDNTDMNILYLYIYSDQKDFIKMNEYAKKLEGKIDTAYTNMTLASIYFNQGKNDIAHKKIDEIIDKEPTDIQPLLVKAGFLWQEKDIERVLEIYDKIISINSNYVDAYYQKAYIYYNYKGDLDKALEYAKKAVEMDCNTSEYQYLLAEIYLSTEDFDKAIEHNKIAITLTPNDTEKYAFMGYIHLKKKDIDSAIKYYKEILVINPQNFDEISNIARTLYSNNEIKYANEYYQKAYRINPYDYDFIREYSDFIINTFSAYKGIKLLLNFSHYTENRNLKIEAKNRAKRLIKENKKMLNLKEKLQLFLK